MKYKVHIGTCENCNEIVTFKYKKGQAYPATEINRCPKCNNKVTLKATYEE